MSRKAASTAANLALCKAGPDRHGRVVSGLSGPFPQLVPSESAKQDPISVAPLIESSQECLKDFPKP
jgi:hypothetical protein